LVLPRPYPARTPEEIQAITTIKALLDLHQVIPHIEELSTVPDVDGHFDLLNDDLRPIAKLDVQVKKLPDDYGPSPKLQIPLSIFGYAALTTCNPMILLGVDVCQKKAYWYHVPMNVNPPSGQQTVTIHFPLTQVIDGKDTKYVIEWITIAHEHHRKLMGYDKLVETLERLSKASTFTTASENSPGFPKIHEFLDELNSLLDGPFAVVKRRFYPGCWKVGFAYRDFSSRSIVYTLYPIRPDENDAQIKAIDTSENLYTIPGVRAYFQENPINTQPRLHALEVIEDSMKEILKTKLLDHKGNDALATEFMFAIIDRFREQMGLEKKDVYSLSEIETGFYTHLPIWTQEAVEFVVRKSGNRVRSPVDLLYRNPYFNPDLLSHQIMPEEMKRVEERVAIRIERHETIPKILIGYENLPLGFFEEYRASLLSNGVTEIHRLYNPPDYSRIPQGGYLWDAYSPESIRRNLEALFTNVPPAYATIVEHNFPQLKQTLLPLRGATRAIVVFDAKDQTGSTPSIAFYYLRCKDENSLHIEILGMDQDRDLENKLVHAFRDGNIELDGKRYECVAESSRIMRFRYDELPLLDFIYEELKAAFSGYFGKMFKRPSSADSVC